MIEMLNAHDITKSVISEPFTESFSLLTNGTECGKLRYEVQKPNERIRAVSLASVNLSLLPRALLENRGIENAPIAVGPDEVMLTRYEMEKPHSRSHPSEWKKRPYCVETHLKKSILSVFDDKKTTMMVYNLVICGQAVLILPDPQGRYARSSMQIAFAKEMPIWVDQDSFWHSFALQNGRLQVSGVREIISDMEEIIKVATRLEERWYAKD